MDRTALVNIDLEGGRRLLETLEKTGLIIYAAFWFYYPEPDEWRLVFATPMVDRKGSLRTYTLIQSVLGEIDPPLDIPLSYITVMSPKDKLVKALRKNFRETLPTAHGAITTIRLSNNVIDGIYIDGAYIYQVS